MKNRNKGFTLIELLMTISLLGILSSMAIFSATRIIGRAEKNRVKQQKEIIKMAAKSFLQENRSYLPKQEGKSKNITLKELQQSQFLKDKVETKQGNCMKSSYVTVTKISKSKFSYNVNLICGD